jgi:hypothetical protein
MLLPVTSFYKNYLKMIDRKEKPKELPVCGGGLVSETLFNGICIDYGAVKENPSSKKRNQ